MIKLRDRS